MTKKERIDFLEKRIRKLEERDWDKEHNIFDHALRECEVCGCLMYKGAVGTPEIRQKREWRPWPTSTWESVDYIHYPYYCKIHQPKKKVTDKK